MTNRREFVLALAASPLAAATSDEKTLVAHLNKSAKAFRDSVKGLSEAQWNFKAGPDRWSIAECAEHIASSEDLIRGMIETKVLTGPPPKAPAAERAGLDAKILAMITDRSRKASAPEPLQPKKAFGSGSGAVKHFEESRKKTMALAKRKDLREHAGEHPVFKELDANQWLLFLSGHTERHTAQILEVKAAPGYPA